MNQEVSNAVAGPSTSRSSPPPPSSNPQLFLPPPAPPKTHPTYLPSTQDLLGTFHLLSAYDKYVRPSIAPISDGINQLSLSPVTSAAHGLLDKGKGKEVEAAPPAAVAPNVGDGDDKEGVKSAKKNRNNYKHLIKGVPGKHSMKKDEYLSTLMQAPPKQHVQITPFDDRTQREAFTVSLEGLKGWNLNALVLGSAQVREDRKRQKEAKRLQKLQMQAALAAPVAQPQPLSAATSPSLTHTSQNLVSNGIPRPVSAASVPRPASATAITPTQRPLSAAAKNTIARPGSSVPRPGSAVKPAFPTIQAPTGKVSTPVRTSTPLRNVTTAAPISVASSYTLAQDGEKRGMKREREDIEQSVVNGVEPAISNGNMNGNNTLAIASSPKAVINAKAGTANIRPRPIKKQRMDLQGQTNVTITQQPTPQGV